MKTITELLNEELSFDKQPDIKNLQNTIENLKKEIAAIDLSDDLDEETLKANSEEAESIRIKLVNAEKTLINNAKAYGCNNIKQLCELTSEGYISNYEGSDVIGDLMYDLQLYHCKNDAVLYSDGRLVFFMVFKDIVTMCRFFMEFFHYEDKFTGEDNPKDGKWHLYFDAHGDPGTGIENKSITFHLIYDAKGNTIKEIDDAINGMIGRLSKRKKEKENI